MTVYWKPALPLLSHQCICSETSDVGLEAWKIGAISAAVFLVLETAVIIIYILKCRNKNRYTHCSDFCAPNLQQHWIKLLSCRQTFPGQLKVWSKCDFCSSYSQYYYYIISGSLAPIVIIWEGWAPLYKQQPHTKIDFHYNSNLTVLLRVNAMNLALSLWSRFFSSLHFFMNRNQINTKSAVILAPATSWWFFFNSCWNKPSDFWL